MIRKRIIQATFLLVLLTSFITASTGDNIISETKNEQLDDEELFRNDDEEEEEEMWERNHPSQKRLRTRDLQINMRNRRRRKPKPRTTSNNNNDNRGRHYPYYNYYHSKSKSKTKSGYGYYGYGGGGGGGGYYNPYRPYSSSSSSDKYRPIIIIQQPDDGGTSPTQPPNGNGGTSPTQSPNGNGGSAECGYYYGECDASSALPCPDANNICQICNKYDAASGFTACLDACKPSFCCIHDAVNNAQAPNCNTDPNCPLYSCCYIAWWKLHDTIGPGLYLRFEQDEDFYDLEAGAFGDVQNGSEFGLQLIFHHFDNSQDVIDAGTVGDTFDAKVVFNDPQFWEDGVDGGDNLPQCYSDGQPYDP